MRQFVKRALQKAGELDQKKTVDFILTASREIDLLETVLDSLPAGILVCDTSNNLILANKAARRFLSIVSYEQSRESVWTVIPDEMIAEFLAHALTSSDKTGESEFDVELNGLARLLRVNVMPLVRERQVTGSLILVVDITERRTREALMRRMENLASLTTLAAGVAHEIKNPLGSLSIHVQLIQKTVETGRRHYYERRNNEGAGGAGADKYFHQIDKYLEVINEEIDRLNNIVVDFLFAVRPINAKPRRGDINALISELAGFVSFELKAAHIECLLNLAEKLPVINFDAGLMKQALLNLIKNAEAAMSGGGKLTITTEASPGELRIIVADTGEGISEENLSKIFEPYFTTKSTGSGLGLTMVFKIIKEHQGEISVRSRKGEGTVFFIVLPVPQTEQRLITFDEPETVVLPESAVSSRRVQ